ncbi:hypothetical protein HDU93_007499 [Gonapodya sp. JEL0774]|nr:hypothetical protein HDU93_007499 [Gonapodya sp. JEL0774]
MADEEIRRQTQAAMAAQMEAIANLARQQEARLQELRSQFSTRDSGALSRLGIAVPGGFPTTRTVAPVTAMTASPAPVIPASEIPPPAYTSVPLAALSNPAYRSVPSTTIPAPAYTTIPSPALATPASETRSSYTVKPLQTTPTVGSGSLASPGSGSVPSRATTSMDAIRRTQALLAINVDVKKRKEEIMKQSTAIDCCFLMDCTGSMASWIQAAKDKVTSILGALRSKYPEATIRVAFVGYRDFGDNERFIVHDFVSPEDLARLITPITATGGGDAAEDVLGGVEQVSRLKWKVGTRLVIHIADAPPHGSALNTMGAGSDRYFNGKDPDGRDGTTSGPGSNVDQALRKLVNLDVDYHFFRLHASTRRMEEVFGEIIQKATKIGQGGGKVRFTAHEMSTGADGFLPTVLASITTSVARSLAFSGGMASSA